jgi:hypothetical protein
MFRSTGFIGGFDPQAKIPKQQHTTEVTKCPFILRYNETTDQVTDDHHFISNPTVNNSSVSSNDVVMIQSIKRTYQNGRAPLKVVFEDSTILDQF